MIELVDIVSKIFSVSCLFFYKAGFLYADVKSGMFRAVCVRKCVNLKIYVEADEQY